MKILFLSPHTDDVELGCGGTISKLIKEGNDIYVVIFSVCRKSLPQDVDPDTLKNESINSLTSLGIKVVNINYLDYDVRVFNYSRQDILEKLNIIRREIMPDMVFIPSIDDYHQDHKTIAEEGIRCFKNNCTILSYELIWNNTGFKNQLYYTLSKENIEDKIRSLSMYKSQKNRKYMSEEFIWSLAIVRGTQNGVDLAESFEVVRMKIS